MPDSADPAKKQDALSADALRSINFGPSWASGKAEQPKPNVRPERDDDRGPRRDFGGGNDRRDRRGFDRPKRDFGAAPSGAPAQSGGEARPAPSGERPQRPRTEGGFAGERGPRNDGPRRDESRGPRREPSGDNRGPRREFSGERGPRHEGGRGEPRREQFRPVVEVSVYPEEKPFGVLLKAVKASCRTYELFEIAKTILEKNERFVVSVKPLGSEQNPEARLYTSVPDQLAFTSEYEAVDHVLNNHAALFFTTETVEQEAPKGTFTSITRCGFTGEILAPSNYHGYQKTLRDHYAAKIGESSMPFERFASRVETVKDDAAVAKWLESKTKSTHYTLVESAEGKPRQFESIEAVAGWLYEHRKDKLVKAVPFVRFSGKDIEKLPEGSLRTSVEHEIAFQRKFPLDTANAIRGRLRKAGFALYKRGAKGVTYLCGVKRKFRTPSTPPFSDDIQRVFDHIERTQDIAANKLVALADLPEALLGIKPLEASPAPAEPVEGEEPAVAPEAPSHTPEENAKLHGLAQNIRWLVTEGYVTEFSDGRLLALPVMSEAQAKAAAAEDEGAHKPSSEKHGASEAPAAAAVESIGLDSLEPETSEDHE